MDELVYGVELHSVIVINNTIYSLGGFPTDSNERYQYLTVLQPTNNPSVSPTTYDPTSSPTALIYPTSVCPNDTYSGFINTTYQLSIISDGCDAQSTQFISFILQLIDIIDIVYQNNSITNVYTTVSQKDLASNALLCGDKTINIITCYDNTTMIETIINVTNSDVFIDGINRFLNESNLNTTIKVVYVYVDNDDLSLIHI